MFLLKMNIDRNFLCLEYEKIILQSFTKKNLMKTTLKILFVYLTLLFCANSALLAQTKNDFLIKGIDASVDPGVDFFKYATGTWMKNNPIPETEKAWTIGHLVEDEIYDQLKTILAEASQTTSPEGSNAQKVGDFYFAGMDSTTIEKQGVSYLVKELEMISAAKTKDELLAAVSILQTYGVPAMFNAFVEQDAMNSDVWSLYLWQGGLGLRQRDYYFRKDARTENIRKEYVKHLSKMLRLSGDKNPLSVEEGTAIFKIESFLADSSRKLEDLRDPYANYNKLTIAQLQNLTPNINWKNLFKKVGIEKIDSIVVGQPEFFVQLNSALNRFSLNEWKAYVRWHLVNTFADRLSSSFDNEKFNFRGTVMSGVKKQRPRWKRIQDAVEDAMGELLGQVYVQKYYSPKTKQRYEKLVDDIIDAYRERIKNLDWMSQSTKEKVLLKLNSITKKVGYPDKWKDFSSLKIDRTSYLRNSINANVFWFKKNIARLGKPVDRTEWGMTPQTYNAYYNPSNNEIVLPAAIFIIPGTVDSLLDDAVVYSYAGASTIGHELTHGFDDEGRQYDAKGNLTNWWTKEDEEKFTQKASVMIDQFDNYVVLDSMHVNGKATLGENIADLGGLVLGYDAFKKTAQYKEGKLIDGFTPQQRFWLGYAYAWLGHKRPESLAQQIMTDVHAPEFLRVNGPLSDLPDFYNAFGVKEGQPMYRPENKRVKIW